jgi:ribonuclease HI
MKLTLATDGGSRGNPGPSATGVVLKNEHGEVVAAYGEYLGDLCVARQEAAAEG